MCFSREFLENSIFKIFPVRKAQDTIIAYIVYIVVVVLQSIQKSQDYPDF